MKEWGSAMHRQTKRNTALELTLYRLLTIGLFLSLLAICAGGLVFLWNHSQEIVNDSLFQEKTVDATKIEKIFEMDVSDRSIAAMLIGIIILMLTPLIRVLSCAILFAVERDLIYVVLSAVVLAVLLFSIGSTFI